MDLKRKQDLCITLLDDEEEVAKEKRARRRIWVKPWLQRRVELGIYSNPRITRSKITQRLH